MPTRPTTYRPQKARISDGRASASARGYDARWRRLRLVILERQPICRNCRRAPSVDVDHFDGDVSNMNESNLWALCHSCHSKKTVLRDQGFGRERKRVPRSAS